MRSLRRAAVPTLLGLLVVCGLGAAQKSPTQPPLMTKDEWREDLRYFASQSWPYPHSLMIAFTAEYAGGELRLDPNEIAEARWFGPGDALPELSPGQSISRALIDANLPK